VSEFINTIDVLGDDAVMDGIINKTIHEFKDDNVVSIRNRAFIQCTALEAVECPNVVQTGSMVFYGCTALKTITLPKLSSTGSLLVHSTAVSKLVLPSLRDTGSNFFRDCNTLKYVDLPICTSLGAYTFAFDPALETIILRSETVCTLDSSVFYGSYNCPIAKGTGYIYVPRALVDNYKAATNWSVYANQIRALEDYTVDGTTTGELDETKI
jgi:hypothetical protein